MSATNNTRPVANRSRRLQSLPMSGTVTTTIDDTALRPGETLREYAARRVPAARASQGLPVAVTDAQAHALIRRIAGVEAPREPRSVAASRRKPAARAAA